MTNNDLDYLIRDLLSVDPDLKVYQVESRLYRQGYRMSRPNIRASFRRVWAQLKGDAS